MTTRADEKVARSPVAFLSVAVVLTGAVLAWLGWDAFLSYRDATMSAMRDVRIAQLRASIMRQDEVLTMSAKMAAATGDVRWEDRYRQAEPVLLDAIQEAASLSPGDDEVAEAIALIDASNRELVALADRAFRLSRKESSLTRSRYWNPPTTKRRKACIRREFAD